MAAGPSQATPRTDGHCPLQVAAAQSDGRVLVGPGTFMFNAPGAVHGSIGCDLTLFIHCCSGEPDEIVSADLIDFEPKKQPGSP